MLIVQYVTLAANRRYHCNRLYVCTILRRFRKNPRNYMKKRTWRSRSGKTGQYQRGKAKCTIAYTVYIVLKKLSPQKVLWSQ
jgi:hypothetical protein